MGAIARERPVATAGLAATLAMLKITGDLTSTEILAGRAKDRRDTDPSALMTSGSHSKGPDGKHDFDIKLEYKDEFGRKLTQKEAFRQLNYAFHGYGPGKKNQERRLKQLEEEKRRREGKFSLETGTLKALHSAQTATGMAHVTLDTVSRNAEQEKKAIERVVRRLQAEEKKRSQQQ